MDDFVPCKNGEPVFSRAYGNELWVTILEKAWAKLHGSYEHSEAGQIVDIMRDLTGAPSYIMPTFDTEKSSELSLDHKPTEGLRQLLLDFDDEGFIMAA